MRNWIVEEIGLELLEIPHGSFLMGNADEEEKDEWTTNEYPLHSVTISSNFWLGKYPVTVAQYLQLVLHGSISPPEWMTELEEPSPRHWIERSGPVQTERDIGCPIVGISWFDCVDFCGALTDMLGQSVHVRLPTEAEWEYACRAGSLGQRYGELDKIAWYEANSACRPAPVGQKEPNLWGLFDMLGNVSEWCLDWLQEDYFAVSPEVDPKGPLVGSLKPNRGGSWDLPGSCIRSSARGGAYPTVKAKDVGFRIVVVQGGAVSL